MQSLVVGLKVFAITLLAGFGASTLHWNIVTNPDSFGMGIGVGLLTLALLLYQMWFRRE